MRPFHVTLPRRGASSLPPHRHTERSQSARHNTLFTQLRKQNKYVLPPKTPQWGFFMAKSGPALSLPGPEGLLFPAVFADLSQDPVHLAPPCPAPPRLVVAECGQWPCGWVLGRAHTCPGKGRRQARNLMFTDFLLRVCHAGRETP